MNIKQLLSVLLVIILIFNMILLGIGKINDILFWIIIGLCGLSSFLMKKWK
ncbi:MAG: hypothetical protein ABIJ34_02010 [archaeon]